MKADLPLPERRRMEAECQREIRDALVHRHFAVIEEREAIAAVHVDYALRVGPTLCAVLNRMASTAPAPPVPDAPADQMEPESAENLRAALGLT